MERRLVTVAISGAFDPIHVGQIRYIREATKLGDRLVIILNSDEFLLRKKGFVFMPFAERKEILEAIKGVDEVIASIDDDQTVSHTLEVLKPDIFAKGGDGTALEHIPETATCRRIGCELVTNVGGEIIRSKRELNSKIKDHDMEDSSGLRIICPYCANHPMLRDKCISCKGVGKILVAKS